MSDNAKRPMLALPGRWPTWLRYAAAAAIAIATTALRLALERVLATESPFLLFYPAVILTALYLGRGPGLLCLVVCTLGVGYFIMPPDGWFALDQPIDITDLALFVLLAGGLVWLLEGQRRARAAADAARRETEAHALLLEKEIRERQRAEEALRRSNDDLEDFAHIVSHDLKEPLRGISTTARFLLEDSAPRLDPEGHDRLQTLVQLPKRMSALLDALLEYSRVGRAELAMQPADLGAVVGEVRERLALWLREKRASVEVKTPLPTLTCDRARVGQVFSNLIANAVKYNDSTEPRVTIGTAEGPASVFFVRDNGIGIAPEHAGRVFRMFSRLPGRDRYGAGTGSGLALIKKTVERHGGRIWFESTPGRGTTFFFTLAPDNAGAAPGASQQLAHSVSR